MNPLLKTTNISDAAPHIVQRSSVLSNTAVMDRDDSTHHSIFTWCSSRVNSRTGSTLHRMLATASITLILRHLFTRSCRHRRRGGNEMSPRRHSYSSRQPSSVFRRQTVALTLPSCRPQVRSRLGSLPYRPLRQSLFLHVLLSSLPGRCRAGGVRAVITA